MLVDCSNAKRRRSRPNRPCKRHTLSDFIEARAAEQRIAAAEPGGCNTHTRDERLQHTRCAGHNTQREAATHTYGLFALNNGAANHKHAVTEPDRMKVVSDARCQNKPVKMLGASTNSNAATQAEMSSATMLLKDPSQQ